jgi:hypothetical protein
LINACLKKVVNKVAKAEMDNEVVNMTQALDQPEAHDANHTKVEWTIYDFLVGVAIVSHLGDGKWENEGVQFLALG